MKRLFPALLFSITLIIASCSKDNNPKQEEKAIAKAAFDNSNYGYYKGVFVGSTGVIVINVNNDNTLSAWLRVDGINYNFTTTQTIEQGQNSILNFTSGSNSFTFTVAANGSNPTITNLNINGHPDAAVLIIKEISTVIVKCYEGRYTGGEDGIFNAIIYDTKMKAIARRTINPVTYIATGTVNNNRIDAGTVTGGSIFDGTLNGDAISGTWENSGSGINGTWKGTRTN